VLFQSLLFLILVFIDIAPRWGAYPNIRIPFQSLFALYEGWISNIFLALPNIRIPFQSLFALYEGRIFYIFRVLAEYKGRGAFPIIILPFLSLFALYEGWISNIFLTLPNIRIPF
jgi:hypothetical protein